MYGWCVVARAVCSGVSREHVLASLSPTRRTVTSYTASLPEQEHSNCDKSCGGHTNYLIQNAFKVRWNACLGYLKCDEL